MAKPKRIMKNKSAPESIEVSREDNHTNTNEALHKLFLDELADVLDAEQQLVKALPKMAEAAREESLRAAFESHLTETQEHVVRLQQVAESLGETPAKKKCKAMKGLLEEAKEILEENEGSDALDAAIIAAAQKVEHYEIATYGTLCAWARQMGHDDVLELLQLTLEEEKAADDTLTEIAESKANPEAEDEPTGNK
jgi:ferritin-like metal-binding protein YciE